MRMNLDRLKSNMEIEIGKVVSWREVSEATGIRAQTISALKSMDKAKRPATVRCDYIDALCTYFSCTARELIQVSKVDLPISARGEGGGVMTTRVV